MDAVVRASRRPYGFFFAGQIREGGRADMEGAVTKLAGLERANRVVCSNVTAAAAAATPGATLERQDGVPSMHDGLQCTDLFMPSGSFLGKGLGVEDYYHLVGNRTRGLERRGM